MNFPKRRQAMQSKSDEKSMVIYKGYALGRESCMGRLVFLSGAAINEDIGDISKGPFILVIDANLYIRPADFDFTPISGIILNNPDILEGFGTFTARLGVPLLFVHEPIPAAFEMETAIISPSENALYICPDFAAIDRFTTEMKEKTNREKQLLEASKREARTKSGRKIELFAERKREENGDLVTEYGLDGLFLKNIFIGNMTDEEEGLFVCLRNIFEKNPGAVFLVCIAKPLGTGYDESFPTQETTGEATRDTRERADFFPSGSAFMRAAVRAVCRAAVWGKARMIFSGIFTDEDALFCRRVLNEEMTQLGKSGKEFVRDLPVGMLIDCPASAIMSDKLAEDADFFCVDADLLAGNIFGCFNPYSLLFSGGADYSRPVLRMIKKITANALGKPVIIRGNFLSEKNNSARLIEAGCAGFISNGGDLLKIKEIIIESE